MHQTSALLFPLLPALLLSGVEGFLSPSLALQRGSDCRNRLGVKRCRVYAAASPEHRREGAESEGSGRSKRPAQNRTRRRQEQLDGMRVGKTFEPGYDVGDEQVPLEEDDTLPLIETIARAADKRKGEDVLALRVAALTIVCSFIFIVTGNSRPQIQAIAAAIEEDVYEQHKLEPRNGGEGSPDSGWLLLDYGSVVVNVMTPTTRSYYNLEKLWRKGEEVDLAHVLIPNAPVGAVRPQQQQQQLLQEGQGVEDDQQPPPEGGRAEPSPEEDPFWS